ncbi:putative ATP-dependent endonuclease of the OLD family [Vibrio crassostreae]|uniref:AAA family ATPase n=1 Tax=Vibrio sp. 99K-1 TaxID=2607603 RepID=UPI001493D48A|nr:ATP-binding protein [Vibrio sp. 99K-1]CAK2594415.1 putative ATP-dependent endonuclease of the OLD family [Vibrio crassostreae]CAK2595891.1 putative ATP-dependent endonuclease of the OLD family [Vibrio crassostreae]CAK2610772.1 putative ATP-dependent endonuclease of the OLD family [Vibrio crassostreae]CAK2652598.1 putative ATP-dependent endonuclease of the OLD family [Vibrio crassostreae]
MILSGFAFSGYRSFGNEEKAVIAPLQKINFLIGANNSGKSNVMRLICEHQTLFTKHETKFDQLDIPQVGSGNFKFSIAASKETVKALSKSLIKRTDYKEQEVHFEWLFGTELFGHIGQGEDVYTWFNFDHRSSHTHEPLDNQYAINLAVPEGFSWRSLNISLNNSYYQTDKQNIPDVLNAMAMVKPKLNFSPIFIPAIRQIGQFDSQLSNQSDFSGSGIIERLQKLERPAIGTNQQDKKKFAKINTFLRSVLENDSATLEIPHDRSMIIVHMDDKTLPLESLGTGIHEVVILAAAATLLENTVVCIEEPELHLHPILQRKLINYLNTDTNNQYFITTHSAHLLDATEAQIFHVSMEEGVSKVAAVSNTRERSELCASLGYKGSDILQANCVIWVEGPSDRTYLNYWLKAKDDSLVEGIHYSIMFYGGRLASHLSGYDPDELEEHEKELISLRKLNRSSVIMIDSDKAAPQSRINDTKKRLRDEFNMGPGFAWVTEGREVENYLDEDKLEDTVTAVHPKSAIKLRAKGKWENLLEFTHKTVSKNKAKPYPTASKVKVANHYTDNYPADLTKLDLNKRLNQLVTFIKKSNHIE